jgi:hypothetical protein
MSAEKRLKVRHDFLQSCILCAIFTYHTCAVPFRIVLFFSVVFVFVFFPTKLFSYPDVMMFLTTDGFSQIEVENCVSTVSLPSQRPRRPLRRNFIVPCTWQRHPLRIPHRSLPDSIATYTNGLEVFISIGKVRNQNLASNPIFITQRPQAS